MSGPAASSLLKKAGSAGRRIAADVLVSLIATLCVSLIVTNWQHKDAARQDGAGTAQRSDVTGSVAPRATIAAAPASGAAPANPVRTIEIAPPSPDRAHAGLPRPDLPETSFAIPAAAPDAAEPAPVRAAETPAKPRAAQSRLRPTHPPRAVARDKANCGDGCAPAAPAATNIVPEAPAVAPVPNGAVAAVDADAKRRASTFGMTLPRVPVPGVVARSAETVLDGAQSVTGWVTGLVRRP